MDHLRSTTHLNQNIGEHLLRTEEQLDELRSSGVDIPFADSNVTSNDTSNVTSNVSAVEMTSACHQSAAVNIFCDVATVSVDDHLLCRAACLGSIRLVRTLIEGGISVNSTNVDQQTALIVLCAKKLLDKDGRHTMARYLIGMGAEVNLRDRFGKTALMYACAVSADGRLVQLLLNSGADPFSEDRIGFTPLIYGYNSGRTDVIKALSDYCREHGREMVILETELNRNFLSNLKVQRLVGASHCTVPLHGSYTNSTSTDTAVRFVRRLSSVFSDKMKGLQRAIPSSNPPLAVISQNSNINVIVPRPRSRSVGNIREEVQEGGSGMAVVKKKEQQKDTNVRISSASTACQITVTACDDQSTADE